MIKTPLSTVIGGAFWTPSATIVGGTSKTFDQIIQSLFANGEQGFAYDLNDLSTMFQDSAGTVPVTSAGQPVGLIRDKSGRGNHARQTTSASRPILRQNAVTGAYYLEFDGSDDFLVTNSIDFTATDKISLFAGVHKLRDAVIGTIAELSNIYTNAGTFSLFAPALSAGNDFAFGANASGVGNPPYARILGNPSPISRILSAKIDLAKTTRETEILVRQGGIDIPSTSLTWAGSASAGTGNYGNYPLYIGRRGGTSLPFNGHIYSLIGVGRLSTDSETAAIERELAKRTGVTLSV